MKNLPGMKVFAFLAVVLVVAFAVYTGAQSQTPPHQKRAKYVIKFGYSPTDTLDCSNRSGDDIQDWFEKNPPSTPGEAKKRYKLQTYDNATPGPSQGDLKDICLTTVPPGPTSGDGEPVPTSSPKGNKTQTVGYATFKGRDEAVTFENW